MGGGRRVDQQQNPSAGTGSKHSKAPAAPATSSNTTAQTQLQRQLEEELARLNLSPEEARARQEQLEEEERQAQARRQKKADNAERERLKKERKDRERKQQAWQKSKFLDKCMFGKCVDVDEDEQENGATTGTSSSTKNNKKSSSSSQAASDSWDNYNGEWDHLLEWSTDECQYVVKKDLRQYCKVIGDINNFHGLQFKCLLCRTKSTKKPKEFYWEHSQDPEHLVEVKNRQIAMDTLRLVLDKILDNTVSTVEPRKNCPYLMFVMSEDYFLKANVCKMRCLLCGEHQDEVLTPKHLEKLENLQWSCEGNKKHQKQAWMFSREGMQCRDYEPQRQQILDIKKRIISAAPIPEFYKLNSSFNTATSSTTTTTSGEKNANSSSSKDTAHSSKRSSNLDDTNVDEEDEYDFSSDLSSEASI
ncbi:unnamed protein product [Amoebophrya sp. A120]|nr:unnamed protein product [Amoebophrya sp. A120]|eukprot:GSA120T00011238001.1